MGTVIESEYKAKRVKSAYKPFIFENYPKMEKLFSVDI